jgi:hypothetical protein
VNVAVCPAVTVWLAGGVMIVGATARFAFRVAGALVTVPSELLTVTVNVDPPSVVAVAGVA